MFDYGNIQIMEDGSIWEHHFILPDGREGALVCPSAGCSYCSGYHEGCRNSEENMGLLQEWICEYDPNDTL